jgi:hypothetical protein
MGNMSCLHSGDEGMSHAHFKTAIPIRRYRIGNYAATLLSNCETTDTEIEYAHALVIYQLIGESQTARPALIISSETNANARHEGYYFLCSLAQEHHNYGASPDWADLHKFEKAALQLAEQMLEVPEPAMILSDHEVR